MDEQQQQQQPADRPADGSAKPKQPDQPEGGAPVVPLNGVKKAGARRNPWGNMSYADLITQVG